MRHLYIENATNALCGEKTYYSDSLITEETWHAYIMRGTCSACVLKAVERYTKDSGFRMEKRSDRNGNPTREIFKNDVLVGHITRVRGGRYPSWEVTTFDAYDDEGFGEPVGLKSTYNSFSNAGEALWWAVKNPDEFHPSEYYDDERARNEQARVANREAAKAREDQFNIELEEIRLMMEAETNNLRKAALTTAYNMMVRYRPL